MEAPLLALTRRRPDDRPIAPSPDTMADNMRQLVQLRWLAVAGQLVTILAVYFGFGVPLPLVEMISVAALLAGANLVTVLALPRHRVTNVEMTLALLVDMGALAVQLYLSGGMTNPFSLLFLLQVVLGAILLEFWSVWLLVVAATLCVIALGFAHRPLIFPPSLGGSSGDLYTVGRWLAFVLAAVLLTLFIGRISRNLRARDAYLDDLRRRTIEEDGIVRMGLFASGAAHELGTPLATLSVILGDWRRVPQIAGDPELANELEEMHSEVERCKAIVGDILRSAGEPRGEAMAREYAVEFLQTIVAEWRATYPETELALDYANAGSATVAAEPQLRQAIWNLLENAADVSPRSIELVATLKTDVLIIAVRDQGPGFTRDEIAKIGKPFRSTKGAGHGVGLFLATNVARQLGGCLVAENLPSGGAEVRIELPAATLGERDSENG
ncbi:MAG TPA: ATP-binding protein [Sphingomicrobium sp.]|nr:ATP-binding protein [Sphingomicrobium sp.]